MAGIITFRHVLIHANIVVGEFGWRVFSRCLWSAVCGQHRTFLSIAFE